jgi:hypothetical protein
MNCYVKEMAWHGNQALEPDFGIDPLTSVRGVSK